MSLLLPLSFKTLVRIGQRQSSYIEQAVHEAINRQTNLIIAISCDEIKANIDCLDSIWEKIQAFLGSVYVIQLTTAYQLEKPLFDCNVVFQDICGYQVTLEPYIKTICILPIEDKALLDVYNKPRETPLDSFQLTDQAKAESNTTPLTENTGPIEPLVFERVAVGGTFDHLHAGHKILLTMTALLARQSMVVGVTDDCMLTKKKHRELIASTSERIQSVKDYMQRIKRTISYEVVPIKDPFGPTVTDPTIDALVVSKETLKGGDLVNNERDMRGYPPLELRIIDVISSENASVQGKDMDVLKISSSWIREYISSSNSSSNKQ